MVSYQNRVVMGLLARRWLAASRSSVAVAGAYLVTVVWVAFATLVNVAAILVVKILVTALVAQRFPSTMGPVDRLGAPVMMAVVWAVGLVVFWARYRRGRRRWNGALPLDQRVLLAFEPEGTPTGLPVKLVLLVLFGACLVPLLLGVTLVLLHHHAGRRDDAGRSWLSRPARWWQGQTQRVLDQHPDARLKIEQHTLRAAVDQAVDGPVARATQRPRL